MTKLLNYTRTGTGNTIILIHGLLGDLSNLGALSCDFTRDHDVINVDLRNHGGSFHSNTHTYEAMANDIMHLIEHLSITSAIVIGHSMGGKVAMQLNSMIPQYIKKLVILDIAPACYQAKHDDVFYALNQVISSFAASRKDVRTILSAYLKDENTINFLIKSWNTPQNKQNYTGKWRFNLNSLYNNYVNIAAWNTLQPSNTPILFVKAGNSDYILTEHHKAIAQQYPNSKGHIIANASHWLHSEKPLEVIRTIRKFIN